jgi:hypothetical protein
MAGQRMIKGLAVGMAAIGVALAQSQAHADERPDSPKSVPPTRFTTPRSDNGVRMPDGTPKPRGIGYWLHHPQFAHDRDDCRGHIRRPHSP